MRLIENLRSAEERSRIGMRHGMERAREEWTDAERRIRQKMRVYPQKLKDLMVHSTPETENEAPQAAAATASEHGDSTQRPIVSINGQDVTERDLEKKRPA